MVGHETRNIWFDACAASWPQRHDMISTVPGGLETGGAFILFNDRKTAGGDEQ